MPKNTTGTVRSNLLSGPSTEPPLGEVLTFMRLIWGISHGLQATSKRMEATIGVTGPQRLVIRLVGRRPRISAGELARLLRLHPSTLTGVLQRLEQRDLVTRSRDRNDNRQARFSLTPAGRRIDRRHAGTVEAAVRRTLATLDRRRVRVAAGVLAALAESLSFPARGAEKRRG